MNPIDMSAAFGKSFVVLAMVLSSIPILIWMERKCVAYMNDERTPDGTWILKIGMGGVLFTVVDFARFFARRHRGAEDFKKPLCNFTAFFSLLAVIASVAAIPFSGRLEISGCSFSLQIADIKAGMIYVISMFALGTYAVFFSRTLQANGESIAESLHETSELLGYYLALCVVVASLFMTGGSFDLTSIVLKQGSLPWYWNLLRQPFAFVVFFATLVVLNRRLSSKNQMGSPAEMLLAMTEYSRLFVGSLLLATLFLAGWQIPFVGADSLERNAVEVFLIGGPLVGIALITLGGAAAGRLRRLYLDVRDYEPLILGFALALPGLTLLVLPFAFQTGGFPDWIPKLFILLLQFLSLILKSVLICAIFIWIRWTMPDSRYVQIARLGWRLALPFALLNFAVAVVVMLIFD